MHLLQLGNNFLPTFLLSKPVTLLSIDGILLEILGKFDHMNESHFKTFIQDNICYHFPALHWHRYCTLREYRTVLSHCQSP